MFSTIINFFDATVLSDYIHLIFRDSLENVSEKHSGNIFRVPAPLESLRYCTGNLFGH